MKVGILTVNRAINVGAVLQCYALQEVLKSLGHDVWVINYRQPEVEKSNRPKYSFANLMKLLFHGHLRSVYYYPRVIKNQKIKNSFFDSFLLNYLHCTPICDSNSIPTDFDVYVIGSDQVWNRFIFHRQDPIFWGHFHRKDSARLVSYAASTSIESINKTDKTFIEDSLKSFSLISVRERQVANYINDNFTIPVKAELTIDPTLMATPNIWNNFVSDFVPSEPYVFVYAARTYRQNPSLVKKRSMEIAMKLGCQIVYMSYTKFSPVDYVALIRNSKAVITSSFHGVAFSLIFNKQLFALLYGDEQDYRYRDLLESLGASDRLFNIEDDIPIRTQDYTIVNKNINSKKEKSVNFLRII